ncbi:MAG TPA: TonB-dependent siderophore receptor [Rhizomicrobium sp.]
MEPARAALGLATFGITSAAAVASAFGQTVASNDDGKNTIETVNVTARKTALDKLPQTVLDTPQSINVVPLKVIQEQGVASLQDALKNVPGVTLNAGEGGAHGDTVNLRGFSASDDFFLDGLRDTGFYTRDSFNYESLEVYKGPASTLFGRGSTGGVINQISKTPQLYPIIAGTASVGTADYYRGTVDVNEMFGDDDAFRVNAMEDTNHVEGRDDVRNRRLGFAPSVAFGLDTPTTLTLSYFHEEQNDVPDFGVPFLNGAPVKVPRDTFYGLADDDSTRTNVNVLTGTFNHDFGSDLSINDKARYGFYRFDTRMTAPHYGNANCYTGAAPFAGGPVCTGAAADVPVTPTNPLFPVAGMPQSQIFVQRDRPSASGDVTTLMNETDLTWKFATANIAHTLIAGVELDKEEAALIGYANQDTQIVATPLLNPDPLEAFPGHQTVISRRPDTRTNTVGFYAIDTIDFTPQWSLIGALREDRFNASYDEPVSGSHFDHTDWILTPRAALLYKPTDTQSYYFSYGTSFDPSAENLSLSARNADLPPEKDHSFELGGKQQILGGLLSLTEALFDTTMNNARISDPLNPALQVLSGNERAQGAEFDVAGNITEHWEILGGYTYLIGKSKGLFGPGIDGPIPNTAHDQANLWTTYDFDSGLKLGVGANYLGRRAAFKDAAGAESYVPSYVTFDAMAAYQITDNVQLQLNGYNLFDKYYYANTYFSSDAENHAVPGAGRTFLFTVAVNY